MSASDRHNDLVRKFVVTIGSDTKTNAELMVAMESILTGAMHLSTRLYGVQPAHATTMLEAAFQRATERFAAQEPQP